jgi:hypothetical protein
MRRLVARLCGWFALWFFLPLASKALGATDDLAATTEKARVECAAGNYQLGVRLLAELWVKTKDTTWIYNQARCYEQNGQNEGAATKFREYLRVEKSLPSDDVRAIESRIAMLSSAQTPLPGLTVALPASANPAVGASLAGSSSEASPASTSARPFYKTKWFWGAAAGAVVAGTVTAILLTRHSSNNPCGGSSLVCTEVQ